jgi:phosphoglucosamine mutase
LQIQDAGMSRKYFGTDGIRGKVGVAPITPEFVLRLGHAAGRVLASHEAQGGAGHGADDASAIPAGARPTVMIGKDTRISGYMLESALEAGLSAAGVDVLLVGPMSTPGVAYLTRALRLSAGIMISASHNPFDDNGIKFFSGDGRKLDDAVEAAIELRLDQPVETMPSMALGKVRRVSDAAGRYIEFCKSTFPAELNLRGYRLVVDCANGAAWDIAPHVFRELGAEVFAIANQPNGMNINDHCGATHPEAMRAAVLEHRADFGLALDGDADRLLMCDADGRVFDGDQLLFAMVKDRHLRGALKGGVAGTLMSNFALEQAFATMGVPFARAKVGDRYVLEMLRERGWECGGENSGHLLCLDKHSTGDGIISALQVLAALRRNQASLAAFTGELLMFPQVLVNVRTSIDSSWQSDPAVAAAVATAEQSLAGRGRVLLRASGTEPVIRVMVEGRERELVERLAAMIADAIRQSA